MNAGRELDALVAEKVMGLVPCTSCIAHPQGVDGTCFANPDSPDQGGGLRAYSSDIEAAWEVVEKLHDQGWVVEVTRDNGTGCYCEVWRMGDDGLMVPRRADEATIPLAICAAALMEAGVST